MNGNQPSSPLLSNVYWIGPNNFNHPQSSYTYPNATNSLNGTYWYFINYTNGCSDSISVNVTVESLPVIVSSSKVDNLCFDNSNGSIELTLSQTGYNILWSNGSTSQNLYNLPNGEYTVTVSNNGCTIQQSFTIQSPDSISINIAELKYPFCNTITGKIQVSVTGGIAPYTYQWQPSVSSDSLATNLAGGVYSITVTDQNGCTAQLTVNLNCVEDTIIIPQLVTPNNDGKNDVWAVDLSNYPSNQVKIFNRWGNLVYSAAPYTQPWDGRVGDNIPLSLGNGYLPVGTYFYVIDLLGDGTQIFKGYLELQY
jgi:gliding motility-associated-like protein